MKEVSLLLLDVLLFDVLKEVPLLLFDVLLDVVISAGFFEEFLLDEGPNLDCARTELERELLDGRGGGIKALAEICRYLRKFR